jgi:hypothetical protein
LVDLLRFSFCSFHISLLGYKNSVESCVCMSSPVRHSQGDFVDTLIITVEFNGVLMARWTIGQLFTNLLMNLITIVE